jgi:hypothetical protein
MAEARALECIDKDWLAQECKRDPNQLCQYPVTLPRVTHASSGKDTIHSAVEPHPISQVSVERKKKPELFGLVINRQAGQMTRLHSCARTTH